MTPPDGPPFFSPPRTYVLEDVWDVPDAAARAERLIALWPEARLCRFTYDDLPDIVVEEGWDRFPRMGRLDVVPPPIPVLGLFRFDEEAVCRDAERMAEAYTGDGSFPWDVAAGGRPFVFFCSSLEEVRPNPHHVCRAQWRLHQGRGCPHQCRYCSLGGSLLINLNVEQYVERLGDLVRENPWQKTFLIDDTMDVLTLEPQLDWMAPLMRFFEATGDRYLIIHTKSDRVEALLDAGAPAHTIMAWSLAGPTQSRRIEPLTATTEARIEAARRCQDAGMTVRYKFKPIVPVPGWRDEAARTIDLALARTRPDNLSMTVLMWMDAEELEAAIPPDLIDPDFQAAAREAAADAADSWRVGPFPDASREAVYRHYLAEVRRRDPDVPVTISTESLEMWRRLGPDLGFTPATYVCGCGAQATPGRRVLDANPWDEARRARTWDGRPARPARQERPFRPHQEGLP